MLSSKRLLQALVLAFLPIVVLANDVSVQTVPIVPIGEVAAINAKGDTRLYLEDSQNGGILQYSVTGAFTVAGVKTFLPPYNLAPKSEVKVGTPIAAVTFPSFSDVRVYFVSPNDTLAEYIWQTSKGAFRGGPSCSDCLTRLNLKVEKDTILYAIVDAPANTFRVGFQSPGAPGTLSEVVNINGAGWSLAPMPG